MGGGLGTQCRMGSALSDSIGSMHVFLKLISCNSTTMGTTVATLRPSEQCKYLWQKNLHRESLSLVMALGQRSYNCESNLKETRTKSMNWSSSQSGEQLRYQSHCQWLPQEGASPRCGEATQVQRGSFQPQPCTWPLNFISCTILSMKGQKYNRNQQSLQSRRMRSEKQCRVASCLSQAPNVVQRKGKCLLLFVGNKIGAIKPRISTEALQNAHVLSCSLKRIPRGSHSLIL